MDPLLFSAGYSTGGKTQAEADLEAEIISPGSHNCDRIPKRDVSEQHEINGCCVIDREDGTVGVFFPASGEYKLMGLAR